LKSKNSVLKSKNSVLYHYNPLKYGSRSNRQIQDKFTINKFRATDLFRNFYSIIVSEFKSEPGRVYVLVLTHCAPPPYPLFCLAYALKRSKAAAFYRKGLKFRWGMGYKPHKCLSYER